MFSKKQADNVDGRWDEAEVQKKIETVLSVSKRIPSHFFLRMDNRCTSHKG